jgi:predicted phosphodiesterase
MKLLVLADLHLDEITDTELLRSMGEEIAYAGQDAAAMIIAGDLTEAATGRWRDAIRWLGKHYPTSKTIFVPGNHDYYGGRIDTLDEELERICDVEGASFAQCRRLDLGDTRILMTTLWTDMRLLEADGEAAVEASIWNAVMMPDYGHGAIMIGEYDMPLTPRDTIAVHMRQKAWLLAELEQQWGGKTVVITHHAPSAEVAGAMTPLSPCFASNLDSVIDHYRPDAWIFGHTHRPAEQRMRGGTMLRNVSFGYEYEFFQTTVSTRIRNGVIDLEALRGGS